MSMLENEFVIIKCDGTVLRFSDGIIVIYGNQKEADEDCDKGERVVSLSALPSELLSEIHNQTNK